MSYWNLLGAASSDNLVEARLQAHYAAQIAAAPGASLLPEKPDHSHVSLSWSETHGALMGQHARGMRAGLRVMDLTLIAVDSNDEQIGEIQLTGLSMVDAMEKLGEIFDAELELPDVDLPDHLLERGISFGAPPEGLTELDCWFAAGADVLEPLVRRNGGTPLVCSAAQFDIATLIDMGRGRSIGVGLSPGDVGFAEPYMYVTPWPYPRTPRLPELPAGFWTTEGWVGALLVRADLLAQDDREEAMRQYLATAVNACREMAGR